MDNVFTLTSPQRMTGVLIDSPHSGRVYPEDFNHIVTDFDLATAEDRYVDQLLNGIEKIGATFLKAEFPRSYIDPNRSLNDIDTNLLAEEWPENYVYSPRAKAGIGLVRRLLHKNKPLYDTPLEVSQIKKRIDNYYTPYHTALEKSLDQIYEKHGKVWHLNIHSMPSSSAPAIKNNSLMPQNKNLYDFVLGDLDGTSCDLGFREIIRKSLSDMGYAVAINNPYKGAEIVQRYGRPLHGYHSIQLEINKALYLNEVTQEKNKNFEKLGSDLYKLIEAIIEWERNQD